jgi:hypothetical protein
VADVESDLLTGIAQILNDAGAGSYKPAGGYTAAETAIVFGELPTSPDRVIALSLYGFTDAINQNLSSPRLQAMLRGNPNDSLDVGALAVEVFNALQGLAGVDCGTAHVVQCNRFSVVPQGVDGNKRYERADNYALDVNTPATPGRP